MINVRSTQYSTAIICYGLSTVMQSACGLQYLCLSMIFFIDGSNSLIDINHTMQLIFDYYYYCLNLIIEEVKIISSTCEMVDNNQLESLQTMHVGEIRTSRHLYRLCMQSILCRCITNRCLLNSYLYVLNVEFKFGKRFMNGQFTVFFFFF